MGFSVLPRLVPNTLDPQARGREANTSMSLITPSLFLYFVYNSLCKSYFFLKFLLFFFSFCKDLLFSSVWPQIQSCLGRQSAGSAAQLMKLHYDSNFISLNTEIIKKYLPSPNRHTGYLSTMIIPRHRSTTQAPLLLLKHCRQTLR